MGCKVQHRVAKELTHMTHGQEHHDSCQDCLKERGVLSRGELRGTYQDVIA